MAQDNIANLIEEVEVFFQDVDDATFILVVQKFNLFQDSKSKDVNEVFDKFLEQIGLTRDWPKFRKDLEQPGYFKSCPTSSSSMCEDVRSALFYLSLSRFRRVTAKLAQDGKYHTSTRCLG